MGWRSRDGAWASPQSTGLGGRKSTKDTAQTLGRKLKAGSEAAQTLYALG